MRDAEQCSWSGNGGFGGFVIQRLRWVEGNRAGFSIRDVGAKLRIGNALEYALTVLGVWASRLVGFAMGDAEIGAGLGMRSALIRQLVF